MSTRTAPQLAAPVAELRGIRVESRGGDPIVHDVSLRLRRGETLGVVGESGSGKTTLALTLLAYTQGGARIATGEIVLSGHTVDPTRERAVRELRGDVVAYVPQNPGTALNPSMRIGAAIAETLRAHTAQPPTAAEIGAKLASVNLPGDEAFQRRYPHQLSGGQQQRVCIAIALAGDPQVLVLDEPTTGLDVITQAAILEELARLQQEQDIAMVYVSHDLAVVAQVADRIAVVYGGQIIEDGPAGEILGAPCHPYTRGLLDSIPDHLVPRVVEPMPGVAVGIGRRLPGCRFAPRCPLRMDACEEGVPDLVERDRGHRVRCLRPDDVRAAARIAPPPRPVEADRDQAALTVTHLRAEHTSQREVVVAAADVSFSIPRGGCVALVGESGSGKTTVARAISGLHPVAAGEILHNGERLPAAARDRSREQRRSIQLVFQNPGDALNPRHRVRTTIGRSAQVLRGLDRSQTAAEVARLLDLVRLPQSIAERYPGELSGGERQRVGIARALAADPSVIVCDEITSALDVSVQAAILTLLGELRSQLGLAVLFISHDLSVIANVADSVLVLEQGIVCEAGRTDVVLRHPEHPYTQRLLRAAPSISEALDPSARADDDRGADMT